MKTKTGSSLLHPTAFVILIIGWIASLGFMFYTGRSNESLLLMTLFFGWVSLPYASLLMAIRWSPASRKAIYILMIAIPVVSLLFYSGLLGLPGAKPAAVFLIVPLASLVLLVVTVAISRKYGGG